jgi:hypothetical protein
MDTISEKIQHLAIAPILRRRSNKEQKAAKKLSVQIISYKTRVLSALTFQLWRVGLRSTASLAETVLGFTDSSLMHSQQEVNELLITPCSEIDRYICYNLKVPSQFQI